MSNLGTSREQFIQDALLGIVKTPLGDLSFTPGRSGCYSAFFEPFHQEGLERQQRLNVLRLEGAPIEDCVDFSSLGWHLRAASKPYHGLEDLLVSFNLEPVREKLTIEVIAAQVALIDTNSYVSGMTAHLGILLANGLNPERARLGYRVLSQGATTARGSLQGKDLSWEQHQNYQLGRHIIEVPVASVVQCFASFDNIAQHFYWVTDPSNFQNPRRASFEAFDPGLSVLCEFLAKQGKGQNARDLEVGVAWLLWLLGFSTANLGVTAKTQDFADLLATTPAGHFLVIECTTGLLKADNKLPKLLERTQAVRVRIQASNNSHLKVIPVLITSKSRDDVKADLDQAERLGVLVITKENLEEAPSRTLAMHDADALFAEAERLVEANLKKYRQE